MTKTAEQKHPWKATPATTAPSVPTVAAVSC